MVEAQGDSTQLHYIVTDLTGTARELCSEEGEVRWRGEQGLWGAHREERRPIPLRRYLGDAANEEVYCELRYQGQLYDAETGLYYNRHRYYDAESGQYLSPDPIGLRGGLRPQGYVHNPLEWVDPLGLEKKGPQTNPYNDVETPWGTATQSMEPGALAARGKVEEGATLYRVGTTGRSETEGAQFWALEHPHSPGYADRYGIPQENVDRSNFIMTARLKPGSEFITRPAPGIGDNLGGGIEVVVPKDAVSIQNFSLF
ncbi:RHS repeat-associated core domain-containing protein [Pectobacterium polonicum]|uniref:RHS repeat-associated core domain-containing protein n=1 Tax=Pectobacterium polonicum TaxID=2485124 RepID=A0ABV1PFH2_9GAMM|nr:RHS repeat-associated core domain-containing protein [Pectobacterium polonicum]MDC9821183.1 RHS domain-containing protein [Pectobacterium polonicum]